MSRVQVEILSPGDADVVVDVLVESFFDYPVMRFVLGSEGDEAARLHRLVELFVRSRVERGGTLLGARDEAGAWAGVATVTVPDEPEPVPAFVEWRERQWIALGERTRLRYLQFAASGDPFEPPEPHHHLNMIGVRRSHRGRGVARPLLERVHAIAAAHPGSSGVSLSTESPSNVRLYEHFGYRVLGHARIAEDLESWVMFRAREGGAPAGARETSGA